MDFLRQFKIRARLMASLAIALVAVASVGLMGWFGMQSSLARAQEFIDHEFALTAKLGDVREAMATLRRYEKDILIGLHDAQAVKQNKKAWDDTNVVIDKGLDELRSLSKADDLLAIDLVSARILDYRKHFAGVHKQIVGGAIDTADTAAQFMVKVSASFQEAESALVDLSDRLKRRAEQAKLDFKALGQRLTALFLLALACAVALTVPSTLLNMRSICKPLDEAVALADRIAVGDLSETPVPVGRDEAADMQRALARMTDNLRNMIAQVMDSTNIIQTASREVAEGNSDLSNRTELQASSLQQAASSMEQMNATVKHSAEASRQANELADTASQVARQGGSVVQQVVTTMHDIRASSSKIADIIGVIDSIAFQTNILALNAAVEAARAGEQGRGFAVVAGEVRSLAQRSAEAAKEIKALIQASVQRIEAGAHLVEQAGATMGDIVQSVNRVNRIMSEINASTVEQSKGIGSVSQSVNELDRMTQQNAAMVEESAAAAESLKTQTARLAGAVNMFKLGAEPRDTVALEQAL